MPIQTRSRTRLAEAGLQEAENDRRIGKRRTKDDKIYGRTGEDIPGMSRDTGTTSQETGSPMRPGTSLSQDQQGFEGRMVSVCVKDCAYAQGSVLVKEPSDDEKSLC